MSAPPFVDGAAMASAVRPRAAVAAIRDALLDGLDPAADPARQSVAVDGGELLVMPSHARGAVGVKVLTVADEARPGSARIQGRYVLFDGTTLSPTLVLDGAALTTIRTPAVSFAPFEPQLATRTDPVRAAVLGTGPQGVAHAATLRDVLPPGTTLEVTYISRTSIADGTVAWAAAGSAGARAAIEAADVVVCATTAREPVLERDQLRPDAIVVAVGSHSPHARELGSSVLADSHVVVEDRATALRECGDVVLAIADGALDPDDLVPMREVVTGGATAWTRPVVFKTSGMSWQDLVIAQAIARAQLP